MSKNGYLDQFFKKEEAPKPAQKQDSFTVADKAIKTLTSGKSSLKKVQKANLKEDSERPKGYGEARKAAAALALDPESDDVLKSALYMAGKDENGQPIKPTAEAATVNHKYSIDPGEREKILAEFKADPKAAAEKYKKIRDDWRSERALASSKFENKPSFNDPTAGTPVAEPDPLDPNQDRFARSSVDTRPEQQRLDDASAAFTEAGVKAGENIAGAVAPVVAPPFMEGAVKNAGKAAGYLAGSSVALPSQFLSSVQYSADPENPAFDRTMSFVNALAIAEGVVGAPVSGAIIGKLTAAPRKVLSNIVAKLEEPASRAALNVSEDEAPKIVQAIKETLATKTDDEIKAGAEAKLAADPEHVSRHYERTQSLSGKPVPEDYPPQPQKPFHEMSDDEFDTYREAVRQWEKKNAPQQVLGDKYESWKAAQDSNSAEDIAKVEGTLTDSQLRRLYQYGNEGVASLDDLREASYIRSAFNGYTPKEAGELYAARLINPSKNKDFVTQLASWLGQDESKAIEFLDAARSKLTQDIGADQAEEAIRPFVNALEHNRSKQYLPGAAPTEPSTTSAEPTSNPVSEASQTATPEQKPVETPPTETGSPTLRETSPLTQPNVTPRRTVSDVDAEIEAVKQRMNSRAKPLPGGKRAGAVNIGAEDIADSLTLGKLYFERGYRTFDEWARKMLSDVGRHIQPQLTSIWKQIQASPPDDAVKRVQEAIQTARPIRQNEAVQIANEVRSRQAGALAGIQAQGGSLGKQLGQLKGSFANYAFELTDAFTPDDLAHLTDMINQSETLSPFQKVNAHLALEKITGTGANLTDTVLEDGTKRVVHYGALPTDSELGLLTKVFGPGFTSAVKAKAKSPSFIDELFLLRKASLLTNPRTVARNALGNFVQAVRKEALRPVDAIVDIVASQKSGIRTTAAYVPPKWSATKMVVDQTWNDVKDVLKHGASGVQGATVDYAESKFPLTKGALRFQSIQDVPWQNMARERSIQEQARLMAKGDKALAQYWADHPTEAMRVQAEVDAQMATFAVDNKMAEFLGKSSKVPVIGRAVEILFPFKTVPTNIAADLASANPVGMFYNLRKFFMAANSGDPHTVMVAQKHLVRQMTNGGLGTLLLLYGGELYKKGIINPGVANDKGMRDTQSALNQPPASITVNGETKTLSGLHPLINVLVMGASIQRDFQSKLSRIGTEDDTYKSKLLPQDMFQQSPPKESEAFVQSLLSGYAETMQEFPFFQGIKQMTDAAQTEATVTDYANQVAGSWAPTLYDTFARLGQKGDNVLRRPATPTEAFLDRMGLPVGAVKVDAFGRVKTQSGPADIFNTQIVRTGTVEDLMRKKGLTVTELPKLPHEKDPRNPNRFAQYYARQAIVGQTLYKYLEAQAPYIAAATGDEARRRWQSAVRSGRHIGELAYSTAARTAYTEGKPAPELRNPGQSN